MTTSAPARRAAEPGPVDGGFTVIELIVAMFLFVVLIVVLLSGILSISRATTTAQQLTNVNEQARIATERMTRELRQSKAIRSVSLPSTPGGNVTMTFEVDFNGNGTIDEFAADPELLTYRYEAAAERLTLTANDESGTAVTRPILSEEVTAFVYDFESSLWQYDINKDGYTKWTELDATPGIGNQNGLLDAPELAKIDLVVITVTLMDGPHKQTYQTRVGLRNQAQS